MKAKNLIWGFIIFCICPALGQSIEQGLKHLELEQYESSKNVFRKLINKEPSNPEYYYYMGEVYLKSENPDSARYFFESGIKKKEDDPLNYAGLGKIVFTANPAEGKRNFEKALELSRSKDGRVLSSIADYYINSKNKDIPQAIGLLEKAIKSDSKNPSYYILLGDAYLEKNDGSKAILNYNLGFDLNKNWPYPYLKIGKLYTRARNYNVAVENYNKGLEIDPLYGPLYRETGEVYFKAKQYGKAIASYKKYVELSDKNFDTDLRYASFLFYSKDYKSAISILGNLSKSKKGEKQFIVNRLLAYSYFESGEYSAGLSSMEQYWKATDPKKYMATDYEYYGKLLSKTGQDSLAIINLKKAIEIDTSKSELYGEIGNLNMLSKKYKEAAEMYTRKISLNVPSASDYLLLGKSYYFDKQYAKADTVFSKFVALLPNSPNGYFWRARANAYMDVDLSKGLARPYYEKYIDLTKADTEKYKKELTEAYSSLGAYYMQKKDKTNADLAWKKVKELDPANKEVDEYIRAKY
jgi:tetratricopeptide (TPR) repeat protein